jgi:flagellar biosynthesis regulator FlbT
MAKQKYVKIQVGLSIGNRKSQVSDPVEVEDDVNFFDGELNTLIVNFEDAVKALPSIDGNYTKGDIVEALCSIYNLQTVPQIGPEA